MGYITVNVDVDVEDFIDECYDSDINRIIKILIEKGYLKDNQVEDEGTINSDSNWDIALTRLRDRGRMQLTNEEESIVLQIANKVI